MFKKSKIIVALFVLFISIISFANSEKGDLIYFVPQFSEFKSINKGDMNFLKKIIKKAESNDAKAIICELDTPGGSVNVAFQYISLFSKSKVPIIIYLNPQGISAGMIIALAADKIAINPNGVIGNAMPIEVGKDGMRVVVNNEADGDEKKEKKLSKAEEEQRLADQKFLTVFFKQLDTLAEKNNRPKRVIRATCDPYTVLTEEHDGIEHNKKSPLTLSASEAKALNVVDYVAKSKEDLISQMEFKNPQVEIVKYSNMEHIIAFLSSNFISGFLIALGIIAIFVEIYSPGFGIAGSIGILSLFLFFLGHVYSGSSEWGPLILFSIGIILLILEIFVIPGFGVTGVLGIGCILGSMFWAFGWENIAHATQVISYSLLGSIVVIVLLVFYVLPETKLFQRLSLKSVSGDIKATTDKRNLKLDSLIGQIGITISPLKPNGKIMIDEKTYDAISEQNLIETNKQVVVTGNSTFELKVKELS